MQMSDTPNKLGIRGVFNWLIESSLGVGILLLIGGALSPSYVIFILAFSCIVAGAAQYIDDGRHRLLRRITFGIGYALAAIGIYVLIKG